MCAGVTGRRELLAVAVLVVGATLFSFMLLEVGVRMLHLVPDRFWEPDPLVGARLTPGSSGWWTQEDREFVVPIQINSQGRRDVERDLTKRPGTFRILVVGDSFVEALQVPLESAFPRVLEHDFQTDGHPNVEVLGAGVSGFGTASELLFFQEEGRRYQPDVVLLAFYPGNDVKNNSPTLEDRFKPIYGEDGSLQRVEGYVRAERGGWSAWLPRSEAYVYARQMLLLRYPRVSDFLVRYGLVQPDVVRRAPERDGIPVDYGVYAASETAEWQDAWQRTDRLLAALRQQVGASGARFAIVVLSTRDQVYPASWEQIQAATARMREQQWDLDAPQRRIAAWCDAHDVPCLLLGPVFREVAGHNQEPLHYPREGHWTAAGHRLAAATIKDFLEQRQLVPTRQQEVKHEAN